MTATLDDRIAALRARGVDVPTHLRNAEYQLGFVEGAERVLNNGPDTYNVVPRPSWFTPLGWRRRRARWMRGFFAALDAVTRRDDEDVA